MHSTTLDNGHNKCEPAQMRIIDLRGVNALSVCVFLREVVRRGAGEYIGLNTHIRLLLIPTNRYTIN